MLTEEVWDPEDRGFKDEKNVTQSFSSGAKLSVIWGC